MPPRSARGCPTRESGRRPCLRRPRRRRPRTRALRGWMQRISSNLQSWQVVTLEPGVGNVLEVVLTGDGDRRERAVHRVYDHRLRGPHGAKALRVVAVVDDLQQAPAVRVELALHRTERSLLDPILDAVVHRGVGCGLEL